MVTLGHSFSIDRNGEDVIVELKSTARQEAETNWPSPGREEVRGVGKEECEKNILLG